MFIGGRGSLVGLLFATTLSAQVTQGSLVDPKWHLDVDTNQIAALWAYDSCSKITPLPGHDWRSIEWYSAPVTELDRFHATLAYWEVDTVVTWSKLAYADSTNQVTILYSFHDVVVLDTAVVNAPAAIRHKIIAHEMLHQRIHDRTVIDSGAALRTVEVPDHVHPFFIFGARCHLMSGMGLTDSTTDILKE